MVNSVQRRKTMIHTAITANQLTSLIYWKHTNKKNDRQHRTDRECNACGWGILPKRRLEWSIYAREFDRLSETDLHCWNGKGKSCVHSGNSQSSDECCSHADPQTHWCRTYGAVARFVRMFILTLAVSQLDPWSARAVHALSHAAGGRARAHHAVVTFHWTPTTRNTTVKRRCSQASREILKLRQLLQVSLYSIWSKTSSSAISERPRCRVG